MPCVTHASYALYPVYLTFLSFSTPPMGTDANQAAIHNVVVTLDTHHKLHIAHAAFWQSGTDAAVRPAPFSLISSEDIAEGKWVPRNSALTSYCVEYTRALEAGGKFQLIIWPEHCLQGSLGHAVVAPVREALDRWIDAHAERGVTVQYVLKGQNCLTEMYSALSAEVPVPTDPSTALNTELRRMLLPTPFHAGATQKLIVCGQAKSHCVAATLLDVVRAATAEECAAITLLDDCTSSVAGFEAAAEAFAADMRGRGVHIAKAAEVALQADATK